MQPQVLGRVLVSVLAASGLIWAVSGPTNAQPPVSPSGTSSIFPLTAIPTALSAPAPVAVENPGIIAIGKKPFGKSYAGWAAAYWKWGLRIPADKNPLTDTTGEFADVNQFGPVWFVAGSLGSSVARDIVVPRGKVLFLPVFQSIFGSGVYDCAPTVPGVTCDVPTLKAAAAANLGLPGQVLDVTIDGVPVQNVDGYQAGSQHAFSVTYPENSVLGVPAGTYFPQVANGYWLMLKPLSPGLHTIEARVFMPSTPSFGTVDFTLTVNLTVQ